MKTLLVIEDEQFVRENIIEILESSGYKVVSAVNGVVGMQLAFEYLPDLILCDVMMPEIDGHAVLEQIRANPTTAEIPFIFLTARADTGDLRASMNLGADDYITKPFRVAELLKAVETRLLKQAFTKQSAEERLQLLRTNISRALPHEFLTPLSGILGFSELLLSSYDSLSREEVMEMLTQLHSSARRIHHLVQNFLLYAKLVSFSTENKKLHVSNYDEVLSPQAIIQDVVFAKAEEEQRREDVRLELCPDRPIAISGIYFTKILEELIDNALKYSEAKTLVYVRTDCEGATYNVQISNNGRTLTQEQITEIGAYTQFDRQIYEQQGSGLGLTIVQKLLELHDGRFIIHSQDGNTVVRFEIPLLPISSS
jgi:two-component system, sensor histidine kinase and response regulator